jgi:hypothetical protein
MLRSSLAWFYEETFRWGLLGTDLIATVPKRIARDFAKPIHQTSFPFPSTFGVDLIWTSRTHRSLLHIWVRDLIADLA